MRTTTLFWIKYTDATGRLFSGGYRCGSKKQARAHFKKLGCTVIEIEALANSTVRES